MGSGQEGLYLSEKNVILSEVIEKQRVHVANSRAGVFQKNHKHEQWNSNKLVA